MKVKTDVPRWAKGLLEPRRYVGMKGGRSGGKSHFMVREAVLEMIADPSYKVVCIREIQKSIRFSVKSLMETAIRDLNCEHLFDIQATVIKRNGGSGFALFQGMQDHTSDSLKSLEGVDRAIVDEANQLSALSLTKLTPTIRAENSSIWFAWNPQDPDDAVDMFFAENEGHPDFICAEVNVTDNPWVTDTGWQEYVRAKELSERKTAAGDPNAREVFEHVWRGQYDTRSDKFVFHNYRTGVLDVPDNVVWHYGADWGFASDPNAALRFCVMPDNKTIYIDSEAYEHSTPIESIPTLILSLPDAAKWPIRADSARPETIDYCRRHGLPNMRSARKGKGSIEHGIMFLQSCDIVIAPNCVHTEKEIRKLSYKIEKSSGIILPVVEDENNHLVDALRYAAEDLHRRGKMIVTQTEINRVRGADYGVDDDDDLEDEMLWKVA